MRRHFLIVVYAMKRSVIKKPPKKDFIATLGYCTGLQTGGGEIEKVSGG
jgi:hypothetical protein